MASFAWGVTLRKNPICFFADVSPKSKNPHRAEANRSQESPFGERIGSETKDIKDGKRKTPFNRTIKSLSQTSWQTLTSIENKTR